MREVNVITAQQLHSTESTLTIEYCGITMQQIHVFFLTRNRYGYQNDGRIKMISFLPLRR